MHESWWVILRFINDYDVNVTLIMNNLIIIELIEYLDKNNNMSMMEDQIDMTLTVSTS